MKQPDAIGVDREWRLGFFTSHPRRKLILKVTEVRFIIQSAYQHTHPKHTHRTQTHTHTHTTHTHIHTHPTNTHTHIQHTHIHTHIQHTHTYTYTARNRYYNTSTYYDGKNPPPPPPLPPPPILPEESRRRAPSVRKTVIYLKTESGCVWYKVVFLAWRPKSLHSCSWCMLVLASLSWS